MNTTIGAVHISSDHPKQLGEFYQQVLGIEPETLSDQAASFVIGDTRLVILPHDQVRGKNTTPARMFFDLMVDDVAAEFQRVVALGAAAISQPYNFSDGFSGMNLQIATLADPDGNYFQLMSVTPA